ncbi:hypothetical protein BG08_6597 (plasmid) [Bacillus thuringiensis serovar kurstaki]|nr:hypothetical protein BG08_6356 [Bacillus thuringiensis serovar kurstaki]AJK38290.1 hypothetical protein BG08_6597 [Bacillus thuringiensis serovar kurstaki]USP55916.1 hypothetical protein J2N67_006165 [Bacillus thuringiensis]
MFTYYFIIRLIRLHLKIRVPVAVITKLHTKKPILLQKNWFFTYKDN